MNKCYRFFCASWFVFSYIFLCCSYLFSQFLYNNNLYSGCPFESSLLLYYASIRYIFLFFFWRFSDGKQPTERRQ